MRQGVGEEAFDNAEAVGATVEGENRVAFDFGTEGLDFGARDVGEVGDDEIEGAGDFFKEIAAQKFYICAET